MSDTDGISINSIRERIANNADKTTRAFSVAEVQYLMAAYEQRCLEVEQGKQNREIIVKENDEQRRVAYSAVKERDETRKQFADLKERLHQSEIDNADNRGYLRRVAEDDLARDGFEQFDTPDGTTLRPRRPPAFNPNTISNAMGFADESRFGGSHPKKTHWVNY